MLSNLPLPIYKFASFIIQMNQTMKNQIQSEKLKIKSTN